MALDFDGSVDLKLVCGKVGIEILDATFAVRRYGRECKCPAALELPWP